jgi:hypothetical protein
MPKIPVIVRAVPKNGFFRAGQHWPNKPLEIELDPDVIEVLSREPKLVVTDNRPERDREPAPKPPKTPKSEPKPEPKPDGKPNEG